MFNGLLKGCFKIRQLNPKKDKKWVIVEKDGACASYVGMLGGKKPQGLSLDR